MHKMQGKVARMPFWRVALACQLAFVATTAAQADTVLSSAYTLSKMGVTVDSRAECPSNT